MEDGLRHGVEFRRCLIELDVAGIQKLWAHVSPHLPQPKTDDEALHTLHLARTKVPTLPLKLRMYSQAWLAERERKTRIAAAVGIVVMAPKHRRRQALDLRAELSGAVMDAYQAGVDLAKDAAEVSRRMDVARDKHYACFV